MLSTGDGHLLRVMRRGAVTTGVQRLRTDRRRRAELRPVGDAHRARFAGAPGNWLCLGGDVLYDRCTMDWSPFLLFVTADTADDRQIALARLALDGSWRGFEFVQDFPSLGPGDVQVCLDDGPIVCVQDGETANGSGRLLVLCRALVDHEHASPWQHCVLSLSRTQTCALLYCGPPPAMNTPPAVRTANPWILLAERSSDSQTVLRWQTAEPAAGEAGLALAAQAPVPLAHSYCTAQPCSICWALACADHTFDQSGAGATGACFIGLENGRILKMNALEILGSGEDPGRLPVLLHSCDLAAGGPEPVLHLRVAAFGSGVQDSGPVEVVVAQQRSAVHLISADSLAVLRSVSLTPPAPSRSIGSRAEKVLRNAVLLDCSLEGCAGGMDELVLVDLSAASYGGSVSAEGREATREPWKVSTPGCFAIHGGDLAPDGGGEAIIVGRYGIDWQDDDLADRTGSQNSASSQLSEESTQYGAGTSSGDGECSNTEVQAIESFAASLQRRLQAAQQSLHHKQRLLVEKGSLVRYTQKLLVETAAGVASGTGVSSKSAFAHNDPIARSGLRPLLQPRDHPDRLKFSEEARAQAAMAAAGFFPTGFAGLVVPKSSDSSNGVAVPAPYNIYIRYIHGDLHTNSTYKYRIYIIRSR